jgi:segregation and condensation protein A
MKSDSNYTIQLPIYEGPLDLLLELIQKAELDITKVSLARVTDQYLSYMRRLVEADLGDLSAFLVIAARLLQIKSEALLPRPPIREAGEEDPGDALARQLIAYKKYKEVALHLAQRDEAGLRTFLRLAAPITVESKLDLSGISLVQLRKAFEEAIAAEHHDADLGSVVKAPKVRIRDRINIILTQLRDKGATTLFTILKGSKSRVEIVVSFLAVLELVKQGRIEAQQDHRFGDITIKPGTEWSQEDDLEFELEFEE